MPHIFKDACIIFQCENLKVVSDVFLKMVFRNRRWLFIHVSPIWFLSFENLYFFIGYILLKQKTKLAWLKSMHNFTNCTGVVSRAEDVNRISHYSQCDICTFTLYFNTVLTIAMTKWRINKVKMRSCNSMQYIYRKGALLNPRLGRKRHFGLMISLEMVKLRNILPLDPPLLRPDIAVVKCGQW